MRTLRDLNHDELAVLVREYLLAGQLMDRAGMPHLIDAYGRDEMAAIAIDEWMGASPIYTTRMQHLLGYEGTGIPTIFKGLQLDIGAPPEFMDFRLKVIDDHHGEFWLDHCGALMDVEPIGEEMVHTMCHTIEDPTFEATACASNPRARLAAVHRPPRVPADQIARFPKLKLRFPEATLAPAALSDPAEPMWPEARWRERIVAAANRLFYREGIRAVSVDAVGIGPIHQREE